MGENETVEGGLRPQALRLMKHGLFHFFQFLESL